MDAVEFINQNLDMKKILEYYDFQSIQYDGKMLRACCKIHDGKNPTAFVVNLENNLWFCHTDKCGGGDVYTLIRKLESCSFPFAVQRLAEILGLNIEDMEIIKIKNKVLTDVADFFKFANKIKTKKEFTQYTMPTNTQSVTQFRDFNIDTLKRFDLRFVSSIDIVTRNGKESTLNNRLLIPVHFYNMCVAIILRRTRSTDYPKWTNQPTSFTNGDVLYNYDSARSQSEIVVVEGVFDVWKCYEAGLNAVATFGAHMTEEQEKLLIKTGADIILCYDGDKAGQEATSKIYKRLKYKTNLRYMPIPVDTDPGAMTKDELYHIYKIKEKI